MKASDLFVRCLEREGVKVIFGLPGEENLDLLESLRTSSIAFVPTRHEQGAAFMADVYGRLTESAGVCLSTLGPGAAQLARPDRRVLAVCGDGGFLMTCQELETAKRLGLSFVVLIFNDNGFGLIKWKQSKKFKQAFATSLGNPDFRRLAESYGAKGYRIETAGGLLPVLKEALSQTGVSVIEVPVDDRENFRFTDHLGNFICPL